jgi:hypothetical protein
MTKGFLTLRDLEQKQLHTINASRRRMESMPFYPCGEFLDCRDCTLPTTCNSDCGTDGLDRQREASA